ncbi:hypothetical protein F511_24485 [Dorcoceras hygrometricum]|uniref:YTH domain-containing family protein n=1 Tax=Dorcoceras hygrometricum TaxID=472368 RepID=A0A2Z7DII1_9LAMI|nr:hypothetical protein F511_24485 [Dorcoceras hygrometricum]
MESICYNFASHRTWDDQSLVCIQLSSPCNLLQLPQALLCYVCRVASPGMEVYDIPDQGLAGTFMIQGTESNPQLSGQLEQFEAMYSDGAPEFIFDQGFYYPTASSYGYICTGFESTGDFEDSMVLGLDGQDIQYTGGANESLPVAYFTPSYAYEQSPYNPYNPYIPGAIIGVDGSYVNAQQYFSLSSYENPLSSPAYLPVVIQPGHDIMASGVTDSYVYNSSSVNQVDGPYNSSSVNQVNGPSAKLFSSNSNSSQMGSGGSATRKNSLVKLSEGSRSIDGSSTQPVPGIEFASFSGHVSSQIRRARGVRETEYGSGGKLSSGSSQLKVSLPSANGLSGFESREAAQPSVHKVRPKLLNSRVLDDVKGSSDALGEQNHGPRTNKFKSQLVVKAYTTRAGNPDANGNITIYKDQYNKDSFCIDDYENAKFFVIKSYSEDDVHKSIKYNVWSSTPNGNRKLNSAYEDAQRIAAGDSRSCPIFLFFSVNASGQFCGVAEMTGPVDFLKDMDFWQQDKWSGSFPVKWHIIKDVPNPSFRHIILENNENKSVTNSRDTQEIGYKKGLEMLQIYKNYTLKTTLLDDFMYYENRQRILWEERTRLATRSYENPYIIPLIDAPRKFHPVHDLPLVGDEYTAKQEAKLLAAVKNKDPAGGDPHSSENQSATLRPLAEAGKVNNSAKLNKISQVSADGVRDLGNELSFGSLTINSKEVESDSSSPATIASSAPKNDNVLTIGSMPVKVDGTVSSEILTFGTIPPVPKALPRG